MLWGLYALSGFRCTLGIAPYHKLELARCISVTVELSKNFKFDLYLQNLTKGPGLGPVLKFGNITNCPYFGVRLHQIIR